MTYEEYRKKYLKPDGTMMSDLEIREMYRAIEREKEHLKGTIEFLTPQETNAARYMQQQREAKLQAWSNGLVNDDYSRELQAQIQHYRAIADKIDSQKEEQLKYGRDIKATMADIENNAQHYELDELVALRVRSSAEFDRHGIAEKMFWEKYAEVEQNRLQRVEKEHAEKTENNLATQYRTALADVDLLEQTERASKAAARVAPSEEPAE